MAQNTAASSKDARLDLIMEEIRRQGLLEHKTASITARVNPDLIRLGKMKAGVDSNSELIDLVLAHFIAEDGFPEAFDKVEGAVPEDMDLSI